MKGPGFLTSTLPKQWKFKRKKLLKIILANAALSVVKSKNELAHVTGSLALKFEAGIFHVHDSADIIAMTVPLTLKTVDSISKNSCVSCAVRIILYAFFTPFFISFYFSNDGCKSFSELLHFVCFCEA